MAGSLEVDSLEELVALAALSHRDGEVEDMGDAAHRSPAELRVGDAAGQDFGAHAGEQLCVGTFFRPIGQAERHHLSAPAATFLRQMRPDEAGSAGDQQLHPKRSTRAAAMRSLAVATIRFRSVPTTTAVPA